MTRTSFLKIDGKRSSPSATKINSAYAVFKDTVIRCRNPFVLYLVAMVIFGPIGFLMEYGDAFRYIGKDTYYNVTVPGLSALGLLTTVGASIVIPMVLFSYFDNRRALDTFHLLPVTRNKMFLGNISAGLFLLFAPYLVTILPVMAVVDILRACIDTASRGNAINWANIWSTFAGENLQLTLIVAVTALMFYLLMSFLMLCCSTILESIGYFAIVMLGYIGLVVMGMNLIGNATFGYTRHGFWLTDILYRFSPIYYFISSGGDRDVWPYVLQMTLLSVVFGLLAWRRAVSRKSEQAGGYIWSPVYYVSAIGGSLVVGLAAYEIFTGSGTAFSLFIGILLGMLAYVILDTIRNRGFKNIVRSLMTGVIGVVGVGAFSALVVVTGTFGYEKWLPTEDNIASVSISDGNFLDGFPLSDSDSIHQVISFHQAVLANQTTVEDGLNQPLVEYLPYEFDDNQAAYAYGETTVDIAYTLKNGRVVTRQYDNVPLTLTRYLYQIAGSTVYSCAIADQLEQFSVDLPILPVDGTQFINENEDDLRYEISVSSTTYNLLSAKQSIPLKKQAAKDLMAALAEDFRRRPEGWKVNPQEQPIGKLSFFVDDPTYTDDVTYRTYELYLYGCDLNTLEQLEAFGYYSPDTGEIKDTVPQNESFNFELAVIAPEDYTGAAASRDAGIFHFSNEHIRAVGWSYEDVNAEEGGMLILNSGEKVPVCQRDLPLSEIEELLSKVMMVGYSDEPMTVLWLSGNTYLIPEENVETVRELVFG